MKTLLYLLLISCCFSATSQITKDHTTQVVKYFSTFLTSNLGQKYFTSSNDYNNDLGDVDTLTIYNDDWSVYRVVILPDLYSYQNLYTASGALVESLSDNLFNSDSLLEFLAIQAGTGYSVTLSVINEAGQILYTFPDSLNGESNNIALYSINGSYKMFFTSSLSSSQPYNIYSLPGTLPCNECSLVSGIAKPNTGGMQGLNVYPNPFNNSLEIEYSMLANQENSRLVISDILGRKLKTIALSNSSDKITLNTSDLPRGTIIVSLYGNDAAPVSKKVIKMN